MPYALIQKNLGQKIDRKSLEEASIHVPSVARADCARIHRELFGIVVRSIPYNEAVAFQTALEHFGFPTELVPQKDLPGLTAPHFRRGILFDPEGFTAIDGLGREDSHPWEEVQFAAGGFLETVVLKTKTVVEGTYRYNGRGMPRYEPGIKREEKTTEREFRLELFLSRPPFRLQFQAGKETLFRFDGAMLRSNQVDQFFTILQKIGQIVPKDCLSLGILAAMRQEAFTYPSVSGMEEEISWHLYHRLRQRH